MMRAGCSAFRSTRPWPSCSAGPVPAEYAQNLIIRNDLVSWSGDAFAVSSDCLDDLVGGLGPLEGLGVVIPELDPLFERAGQLVDRAEDTAVQAAALQFGEPPLHLVQPRGIRRGEMQLEPPVLQQPPLDRRGLVHGEVVGSGQSQRRSPRCCARAPRMCSSILAVFATLGLALLVCRAIGYDSLVYFVPFAAGVLLVSRGSDFNAFRVGRILPDATPPA